jgi:hypothetical protein
MGASSWRSYTPYREDPETALQEVRQRVFEAGEYSMGGGGLFPANGNSGIPDPAAALEKHGLHEFAAAMRRMMNAAKTGDFSGLSAEERQSAQEMKKSMDMIASLKGGAAPGFDPDDKPETIEELLEMVAEDGTHSILDIERTAARKEFGAAIPLPSREAMRFFGTERPDHDQVESKWADVAEKLERWEAYYVTIWKDGDPHEYAFIGCSGD